MEKGVGHVGRSSGHVGRGGSRGKGRMLHCIVSRDGRQMSARYEEMSQEGTQLWLAERIRLIKDLRVTA